MVITTNKVYMLTIMTIIKVVYESKVKGDKMRNIKEIKPLHFGDAEIKPELRNENRLWDVYISQDKNGVLTSNCWSVVRHCYDTEAGSTLVRVYEGLKKDVAYEVNSSVFDNNRRLYDELGIFPKDKNPFDLSDKEKSEIPRKLREGERVFRDSSGELIEQFDLELIVDGVQGTLMIPGKIKEQKYGDPIQYWELVR